MPITSRIAAPRPCGWSARAMPTCSPRFRPAFAPCGARCTAEPTRPASRCSSRFGPTAATSASTSSWPRTRTASFRLMGFGHRVYKNYDPRATIIKKHVRPAADQARTSTTRSSTSPRSWKTRPSRDPYFIERKLYPNVDFYSGIIYRAMGMPVADVHGAVCHRPAAGLDCPLAGNARLADEKNLPPAADLHRPDEARFRPYRRSASSLLQDSAAGCEAMRPRASDPPARPASAMPVRAPSLAADAASIRRFSRRFVSFWPHAFPDRQSLTGRSAGRVLRLARTVRLNR